MKRITLAATLITYSAALCAQTAPLAKTPLVPELMSAVESINAERWPGTPVMAAGATDGRFLNSAGIWTYGITGSFQYPEGANAHSLNEKMPVTSLYDAHEFQYRLGKRLGG